MGIAEAGVDGVCARDKMSRAVQLKAMVVV